MGSVLLILSAFLFISCSPSSDNNNTVEPFSDSRHNFKITTFNVKWFGIGGTMWNRPENEFRQTQLRQFIDQELKTSDLIGFVEVVETQALKDMLKGVYECVSYEGSWSRHQHVVLCYNPKKYRAEKYDEDFVIQEVDLGSGGLRPALQAKICHRNGDCFLQVLGVHLVAGNKSEKRFRQVRKMRDALINHTQTLPTIAFGDFNSYEKERNGLKKDDIDLIADILHETPYKLTSITKGIPSYGSGQWAKSYDHIMVTPELKVLGTSGYLACTNNPDYNKDFIPYSSFNKYFSDHCPVTAHLSLPN